MIYISSRNKNQPDNSDLAITRRAVKYKEGRKSNPCCPFNFDIGVQRAFLSAQKPSYLCNDSKFWKQ